MRPVNIYKLLNKIVFFILIFFFLAGCAQYKGTYNNYISTKDMLRIIKETTPAKPTSSTCGNNICEQDENLYNCLSDCKYNIPVLEPDTEYTVKQKERYQFNNRQIDIETISDFYITIIVRFLDTHTDHLIYIKSVDPVMLANPNFVHLGIKISVVKVYFELEEGKRYAIIKVSEKFFNDSTIQ